MKMPIIITLISAAMLLLSATPAFSASNIIHGQDSSNTGFAKKYWNSLIHGNIDRTFEKSIDLSFAILPSYTNEASIGIGGAATALYRLDRRDSSMQPSDVTLTGNVSARGFYSLSAKGSNHFRGNRSRLSYRMTFFRKNLDFWGISYGNCARNHVSAYTRQQFRIDVDYTYRITSDLHLGLSLNIIHTAALNMADPEYLEGQKNSYFLAGAGASIMYDTRNLAANPSKGIHFLLKGTVYPHFTGTCSRTVPVVNIIFNAYRKTWKGCVLAFDVYGTFSDRNSPWVLREELGSGGCRMRGYYAGRYIDCSMVSAQAELRQHVYGRFGIAAWGGCGTVFPEPDKFSANEILPTFGIGLRFEFKHRMNLRFDYGFGKGTSCLVVQYTEAF